jgi:hypothetical protein
VRTLTAERLSCDIVSVTAIVGFEYQLAPETHNKQTLKPNYVEFDHILISLNPTHRSDGIRDTTHHRESIPRPSGL